MAKATIKKKGMSMKKDPVFVDIYAGKEFTQGVSGICPTITMTRAKAGGFYIPCYQRLTRTAEMLRLQGVPPSLFNEVCGTGKINQTNLNGAIGNAMSVPVLERLLPSLCWVAGLLPHLEKAPCDPWNDLQWVRKGAISSRSTRRPSSRGIEVPVGHATANLELVHQLIMDKFVGTADLMDIWLRCLTDNIVDIWLHCFHLTANCLRLVHPA